VAGIWIKDMVRAMRMIDDLGTDNVFMNMPRTMATELPWGSNVKESGKGKDGSM